MKITHILATTILLFVCISYSYAQKNGQVSGQETSTSTAAKNPFGSIVPPVQKPQTKTVPTNEPNKPQLQLKTINLKFLDAKNLQQAVSKMSSEYGSVTVNEKSNSLIICDTQKKLKKILKEIKNADQKPPQIIIEVVIIDVKLNNDSEIGVNWDILSNKDYDVSLRQELSFTDRLESTQPTSENIGKATAYVTQGTGSDVAIVTGTVRSVVHMLQKKQDVEIIASPRVMVVSGDTASIESKEEIPYNEIVNTSEGGELSQTEFKDVGVKLNVGATLVDSNSIQLQVNTEHKVSTGQSINNVPVVDARIAETSLLLDDGQIVALGGLRRKEEKKQTRQIPLLGDIPLLGWLFKSKNTVVEHAELVVLLSPHLYKNKKVSEEMMKKYNHIRKNSLLSNDSLRNKNSETEQFKK